MTLCQSFVSWNFPIFINKIAIATSSFPSSSFSFPLPIKNQQDNNDTHPPLLVAQADDEDRKLQPHYCNRSIDQGPGTSNEKRVTTEEQGMNDERLSVTLSRRIRM